MPRSRRHTSSESALYAQPEVRSKNVDRPCILYEQYTARPHRALCVLSMRTGDHSQKLLEILVFHSLLTWWRVGAPALCYIVWSFSLVYLNIGPKGICYSIPQNNFTAKCIWMRSANYYVVCTLTLASACWVSGRSSARHKYLHATPGAALDTPRRACGRGCLHSCCNTCQ